jgi:tetratricopeptide (TPR) repeat protein
MNPLVRAALTALLVLPSSFVAQGCVSDENKPPELTAEQKARVIDRYTETAQQYLMMGELDRAEGQTMKALEIDPKNVKCKMIRGWTLQKRGKTQDILVAERIFREIKNEGDYRATLGLAECLERKGVAFDEASEAIASGKRVSEAPDPSVRSHQLVAERDRAWKESSEHYAAVIKDHPDDVDARNGSMRIQALLGNDDASLEHADKLLAQIGPTRDFWEKRMLRPEISAKDEKLYRERIDHFKSLERATHVHAAMLLHKHSRDDAALQHVEAAIALEPDRAELYGRRAEIEKSLGRNEQAIADIDQFLHRSTLTYDHPDVKRAYRLRKECEDALRTASAGGSSGEAR